MANDGTVKIGTELDDSGFKSGLSKLGSVASSALKGGVAVIGSVATAASGAVAGLLALESATEEYRIAQGKLNTAFEAAGYGTEAAAQAYNDFMLSLEIQTQQQKPLSFLQSWLTIKKICPHGRALRLA